MLNQIKSYLNKRSERIEQEKQQKLTLEAEEQRIGKEAIERQQEIEQLKVISS